MINITFYTLFIGSLLALITDQISKKKSLIVYFFFGFSLIFIAGLRDGTNMPDYSTYAGYYQAIVSGQLLYFIEISFIYIAEISNLILNNNSIILFLIYAFIGVSLKLYAIKSLSHFIFYSLVIYISNYFILHEMIQIRAGVASALILLSVIPIYERSFTRFFILVGIATLFHYSSFIFIFLYFLRRDHLNKTFFILLILSSYAIYFILTRLDLIGFISNYIPFVGILDKLATYQDVEDRFVLNVFGLYPLTRILILLFFLYFSRYIHSYNKYFYILLKMYGLGIFAYIALAIYPHISVRIGYTLLLSEIVLIPCLIYTIKGYYTSRLIVILYGFLAFFLNVFFTNYFNWTG